MMIRDDRPVVGPETSPTEATARPAPTRDEQSGRQIQLLELKSERARLEVNLAYLSRRCAEIERQYAGADADERVALKDVLATLVDRGIDSQARIEQIDAEIGRLHAMESGGVDDLRQHDAALTAELDQVRGEVLGRLREIAGLLRRFERLADQKKQLGKELSAQTGRRHAYASYVESALLRRAEYAGDVSFALDFLRAVRPVS